ncbi:MAG: hypothetical protein JWN72_2450 [Thermoleophilia bacterium]|nr:hypothetical protein [Thermoleophilia bacterium]
MQLAPTPAAATSPWADQTIGTYVKRFRVEGGRYEIGVGIHESTLDLQPAPLGTSLEAAVAIAARRAAELRGGAPQDALRGAAQLAAPVLHRQGLVLRDAATGVLWIGATGFGFAVGDVSMPAPEWIAAETPDLVAAVGPRGGRIDIRR